MPQQFVIITVAEQRRLIRAADLREVVPLMALSEVEGRRGLCRGMINLRGEMLPVFDLAGPDATLSPSRVILVTPVNGDIVALLVDDVHDVVTVPDDQVALVRVGGGGAAATVVRLDDEVLSVLSPANVIEDEP
jgi:purine-binding chemotaxis protein CheW